MTNRNTRRNFLRALGATAAIGAASGSATAYHTQDPYVDDFRAADSSNYTNASRGTAEIDWIVIHVGEGDYGSMVGWFQDPAANVSAHYVIRNSDGYASQMVHHEDKAWHAGGQNYNYYSIGLEHGGFTDQTNFTDALYQKSANIVSSLCDQYDIPKTHPTGVAPCDASNNSGGGIIGHHQVPESDCGPNNHTDPGSTWDWDYYIDLVNGSGGGGGGGGSGGFSEGDRVTPTTSLNTRKRPGTESSVVATVSPGEVGEIVNGPTTEDGYTWWGMHWLDRGVWGWSVEQYLDSA